MIQFRLFGIPVVVHPIFWITIGIIGALSLNPTSSAGLLQLALFILAGFLSILVHEFGHALAIKGFRQPTAITLHSFGGFATFPPGSLNRWQSFLVTAAGPGIQIVLGIAALAALNLAKLPDTPIQTFIYFIFLVSVFWAILNCLPIYPLDGGRMLESILGPRRLKVVFMVGIGTAVLAAVWAIAKGAHFMAILMGLFAWENWNHYKGRRGP